MPGITKAILFFGAFCAVMGWAVIELMIRFVGAIWCALFG